jgi:hypothetical protein
MVVFLCKIPTQTFNVGEIWKNTRNSRVEARNDVLLNISKPGFCSCLRGSQNLEMTVSLDGVTHSLTDTIIKITLKMEAADSYLTNYMTSCPIRLYMLLIAVRNSNRIKSC